MPIVFTHLLSGIAITGACFLIMKKPRSLPLLAVGLASFMLPDIDHLLYWEPYMANLLLPTSFSDLFEGLFGPRSPLYLHMWLYPAVMAVSAVGLERSRNRSWRYLALIAVGWAVHLALDGVLIF